MVGGLGGSNGATRLGRRTVGEAAEQPGSAFGCGWRVDDAVALVGVRREPGHGDDEGREEDAHHDCLRRGRSGA